MTTRNSTSAVVRAEDQPLGDLQSVIHEFLALLSELQYVQPPHYLAVLESLLHVMTDLETQLVGLRITLERERLIHNDLQQRIGGSLEIQVVSTRNTLEKELLINSELFLSNTSLVEDD